MTLKISGNICSTMIVQIQKIHKFMCNTSRDIIRYFSTAAGEDPVDIKIILVNKFIISSFFFVQKQTFDGHACIFSLYISWRTLCAIVVRWLFHTRVAEHAGRSARTGSLLTVAAQSMIRNHAMKLNSSVDLDNFNIIGRMNNLIDLRNFESLYVYF